MSPIIDHQEASQNKAEERRMLPASPQDTQVSRASSWWVPKSLTEAIELAKMLAASGMVPKDYVGKPGAALAAIQLGSELGMGPMSSLQNIANINGRPSVWGDMLLAICERHPDFMGCIETFEGKPFEDNYTAVCVVKRRGRTDKVGRFSVADAKRAGLWGKSGPWQTYPQRMLPARARGFGLRDQFSDATKGLMPIEEAQDIPPVAVEARVVSSAPLNGHDAEADAAPDSRPGQAEPPPPETAQQAEQAKAIKTARKTVVKAMVDAFAHMGVTREQIEHRLGHPVDEITEEEVHDLKAAWRAINSKQSTIGDHFSSLVDPGTPPVDPETGAEPSMVDPE